MKKSKITTLLLLSALFSSILFSISAQAWTLDAENSVVSFVSIKKGNIGESHTFSDVAGQIKEATASVTIKPDSVDSRVPIRNERMREFLFETGIYPTIDISADVSEILSKLTPGMSKLVSMPIQVTMHGVSKELTLEARISMLSDSSVVVNSSQPVIVRAADYNMVEGITKLASLVNNLAIAESVPVSFSLSFQK